MAIFTLLATAVLAEVGVTSVFAIGALAAGMGAVASIGLSYAVKALQGTPAGTPFSTQGTLNSGGDVPQSFNFGYSMTAGSLVYANEWGTTSIDNTTTPNAYHTQVIALQDLPGASLLEVWINGALCTLGSTATAMGYPVTQFNKNGADHLWIKYYDGTQTAADSFLTGTVSSLERPYGAERIGTGVCYVIATSLVDDTLFSGFPSYKFAISGIPLYDISKDSSVGGSGSHRWDNKATWGGDGDNNPVVQIYNLLRGISYNGQWLYGLQAMTASRLPASNWIAQINKCRDTIASSIGTEPTYRSGGQINVNAQTADAVQALLTACQGRLSEVGGFFKIQVGTPDATVASITDMDILVSQEQDFTPFMRLADSVNGITATYPSPQNGWATLAAPPIYRTDLEALDGNRRLLANPQFTFVPYDEQVQRLMSSALLDAQRARRHTISLPPEFWILEPNDFIAWTSDRNGYVNKIFRIDGIIDRANLDVVVSMTEVDPTDYDWNSGANFTPVNLSPTIYITPTPQGIKDFSVIAVTLQDASGLDRRPALELFWDGNMPGIAGVQYEIRLAESGVVISRSRTDQWAVGSVIITDGILPLANYQVRAQYIPSSPRDMLWSAWLDVTTPDVRLSAADLDAGIKYQIMTLQNQFSSQLADLSKAISDQISTIAARGNKDKSILNQQAWDHRVDLISRIEVGDAANGASIEALQTVVNDDETAFASYQLTTDAHLAANDTSISVNASSIATLNGYVGSEYSVTLNTNGYATGFNLINGSTGTGGFFSTFTIVSDKFQIQLPGYNGSAPQTVFTVGTINGVASIGFTGNLYLDGSITVQKLSVSTLSAITANLGTVTAGIIQSTNGKMVIDLTNARELISD